MKKHDLIDRIRVYRADIETANAKLRALSTEKGGHEHEAQRLKARLADALAHVERTENAIEGQLEDAAFGAAAASRLGAVLVDLELGVLPESSLDARVRTELHEAKRESAASEPESTNEGTWG